MDDLEESDRFCMVERQPWHEFAESNKVETQEKSKINQWVGWRRVKKHTDALTVLVSRGGEDSRQELPREIDGIEVICCINGTQQGESNKRNERKEAGELGKKIK